MGQILNQNYFRISSVLRQNTQVLPLDSASYSASASVAVAGAAAAEQQLAEAKGVADGSDSPSDTVLVPSHSLPVNSQKERPQQDSNPARSEGALGSPLAVHMLAEHILSVYNQAVHNPRGSRRIRKAAEKWL